MNDTKVNRAIVWSTTLIVIFLIILCIVIAGKDASMTINFTMDNNTLEALKSINYTMVN